ncbi:MAG: precorrin-6y C5,15-methyltransferase (decarboxylating) subunit CbiE [Gammaproteobacteria bacterium]|nr:precorrin-6y C5,15-methyltransferase (decarboxylating) subunit CbiE [Gammaproteobacteria bacterium]
MNAYHVIGVLDNGAEGITPAALHLISQAQVVIGGARTLQIFASTFTRDAQLLDLTGKLPSVPQWVNDALQRDQRVVVLATGDPLCYGIARYLIDRLPDARCNTVPNVSTAQLAFARLNLHWQDAAWVSAHAHDSGEWLSGADSRHALYPILQATVSSNKLAIFTSPQNTPARIARMLLAENFGAEWQVAIANALLQPTERIVGPLSIAEAAQTDSDALNIMLLWRTGVQPTRVHGLRDDAFAQRKPEKGLITKREVRAVSLAYLQLHARSIVWDIGAGSGSVGLEAARLCPLGHVYAAEKNHDDAENARENRKRLGVYNYTLAHTKAPAGLGDWLDPDAVFIGGSGGELEELIAYSLQRMTRGGNLVMNFVTFENLARALATLKNVGATWQVTQMQVARSQPILDMQRLAAENPVWIICAQAGEKGA